MKNKQATTPNTTANAEAEALAKALGQTIKSEPTEKDTFEALIAQLPDSPLKTKLLAVSKKQQEEISRLEAEKATLEKSKTQSKAWDSFKEYFTKDLYPNVIQPKLKELGLDTTNKKLVITFPEGKVTDRAESGTGKAREMPALWGDGVSIAEGGGKITHYGSPKKMAESLNLQVEGRKDMLEVFSNPIQHYTPEEAKKEGFTKIALPKVYKVIEAIRGKGITIEILPKPVA